MFATIVQAVLSIFQNLIPAGGVVFRGWSPATALTLYWSENLVGSVLIALRIAIHRHLTRKRGHYRPQINKEDGDRKRPPTYLSEFTSISLMFTLVHGIFLAALLKIVVRAGPDRDQFLQGATLMTVAQVAGFLIDLPHIRRWSFATLKKRGDSLIGRIGLIQFSIMGGMLISAVSSHPHALFAVFGSLKTMADIAGVLPYNSECPPEAPKWFLWFAKAIGQEKHWKTGQDVATWWRETELAAKRRVEEDEVQLAPAAKVRAAKR